MSGNTQPWVKGLHVSVVSGENQTEAVILMTAWGGNLGLQRRYEMLIYSCELHLTIMRYSQMHTFHEPSSKYVLSAAVCHRNQSGGYISTEALHF